VELAERAVQRVRPAEDAAQAEAIRRRGELRRRRARILQRKRRDAEEPAAIGGAELRDPVVVNATRRDGERGVVDRREAQREAGIEDGRVDPLLVEDARAARGAPKPAGLPSA
jgi:hypothetical protein